MILDHTKRLNKKQAMKLMKGIPADADVRVRHEHVSNINGNSGRASTYSVDGKPLMIVAVTYCRDFGGVFAA